MAPSIVEPSGSADTSVVGDPANLILLKKVPTKDSISITSSSEEEEEGDDASTSLASITSTCSETADSWQAAVTADEEVKILGEIVGGHQLRPKEGRGEAADVKPYCKIHFGKSLIHCTEEVEDIWTLSTRSLFLWEATPRELAQHDLQVSVWYKKRDPLQITTWNTVFLGKLEMSAATILMDHCQEERLEVELEDENGTKTGATLTMRFRMATPSDEAFVARLYASLDPSTEEQLPAVALPDICSGVAPAPSHEEDRAPQDQKSPWDGRPVASLTTEVDETQVAGSSIFNALSSAFAMKSYMDRDCGHVKILIKPGPDPQRVAETTYLSRQEIRRQTALPSQQWVEAGSGSLGKLYLEILSCKDLPNVDVGEAVGNVTDCFITAVFEDVMVQTPVIDDELSPHWLPWMQRAFCINIMHPASMLYLGAFDFDLGLSDHDALGRVAVNLSNLHRNMDYTLTYDLFPSSNVTDRTSAGSITIRVRVEYEDEKQALLAAFRPRPKFHVNVAKEKSLKVVNYTCFGEYGDQFEQDFDVTVIRSYINEIVGYKNALLYFVGDVVRSLVFWRGQVQFFNLMIPLHSFIFFTACTTLIEKPYLTPPFLLLGVGWVMLAALTQRRQHPSPWNDCPSFLDYMEILHQGKSSASVRKIEPNQRLQEVEAYEKAWKDRVDKDLKEAAERWERQQELDKIGNEAIHTKTNMVIPLDLLVRLKRYQGIIGRYCRHARFIKMIVTWEEGIISFWLTLCFLAAGLVALLLPWAFILTWTSRIIVWGLLGPHMMIVDIILRDREQDEKTLAKAFEQFQKDSHAARHRRQDALKLKDTKGLAFGQYVTLVPSFNLSRHFDYPLPCSFASYSGEKKYKNIKLADVHIPGQQFFGGMVPRTESQMKDFERELVQLEEFRSSLGDLVRNILSTETCPVLQRLRAQSAAFEERSMPASVGYEMIPWEGSIETIEASSTDDDSTDCACCLPSKRQSSIVDYLMSIDSCESYDDTPIQTMESVEVPVHLDAKRKLAVVPTEGEGSRELILVRPRAEKSDEVDERSPEEDTCGVEVVFREEARAAGTEAVEEENTGPRGDVLYSSIMENPVAREAGTEATEEENPDAKGEVIYSSSTENPVARTVGSEAAEEENPDAKGEVSYPTTAEKPVARTVGSDAAEEENPDAKGEVSYPTTTAENPVAREAGSEAAEQENPDAKGEVVHSSSTENPVARTVGSEAAEEENPGAQGEVIYSSSTENPVARTVGSEAAEEENPDAKGEVSYPTTAEKPVARTVGSEAAEEENPDAKGEVSYPTTTAENPVARTVGSEAAEQENPDAKGEVVYSSSTENPVARTVGSEAAEEENPGAQGE